MSAETDRDGVYVVVRTRDGCEEIVAVGTPRQIQRERSYPRPEDLGRISDPVWQARARRGATRAYLVTPSEGNPTRDARTWRDLAAYWMSANGTADLVTAVRLGISASSVPNARIRVECGRYGKVTATKRGLVIQ